LAFPPDLETAAALLALIHSNGCTVSLDVGWHEEWLGDPRSVALLPLIDVFLPNESEAARITGEPDVEQCLRRFESAGAKCVAVKLGMRGAAALMDGEINFVPAPKVTPVDTTGAGDCFDAGFLHAWLNDKPAIRCLATGNICGALSTECHGGIAGFPSADRLEQELKNYA
jgi:sugar/nucleoside kinase (ribokinase family)